MTRFFRPRGGWPRKLVFCAAVAACISSTSASADQHSIRIIEEPQVSQPPPFALGVTLSGVPAIIDEDTIRLAGRVVHIFGIDAPESAHKFWNSGTPYPCGAMATAHLAHLRLGHNVECKGEDKLPVGKILGNCRLGKHDLGTVMVGSGWALAYKEESDQCAEAEERAKQEKLGLWRGEFVRPWVRRIKH